MAWVGGPSVDASSGVPPTEIGGGGGGGAESGGERGLHRGGGGGGGHGDGGGDDHAAAGHIDGDERHVDAGGGGDAPLQARGVRVVADATTGRQREHDRLRRGRRRRRRLEGVALGRGEGGDGPLGEGRLGGHHHIRGGAARGAEAQGGLDGGRRVAFLQEELGTVLE